MMIGQQNCLDSLSQSSYLIKLRLWPLCVASECLKVADIATEHCFEHGGASEPKQKETKKGETVTGKMLKKKRVGAWSSFKDD